jgi:hypothetical protein
MPRLLSTKLTLLRLTRLSLEEKQLHQSFWLPSTLPRHLPLGLPRPLKYRVQYCPLGLLVLEGLQYLPLEG